MKLPNTLRRAKNLYSLRLSKELVKALRLHDNTLGEYLAWFSQTKTYRVHSQLALRDVAIVSALLFAMLAQITAGVWLITDWLAHGTTGAWSFGLALLFAYPLVTGYGFAAWLGLWRATSYLLNPKRTGKAVVGRILESQVRKLRRRHHFQVIAVAGSVGKTSTKYAIAELLGQNVRVRYQAGNYNDRVTVPLIFFGQNQPSIWNPFAWMRVFGENAAMVSQPYPYDVVVVELGTDGPGQMRQFAYLHPDITVLTAIAPEHMAFFGSLDNVAAEETKVFAYSKQVLVNADTVPGKYLIGQHYATYSLTTNLADNYYAARSRAGLAGQRLRLELPSGNITAHIQYLGEQGASAALAAAAVADMINVDRVAIKEALGTLAPVAGRMQVLEGVKDSKLIDDTYNASPVATKAALDVLYAARTKQRIAILGSMNELGDSAKAAHIEVGAYCDAAKLDMIATIGVDARRWLAPAAKAHGCVVHSFASPAAAGEYVRKHLKTGAVVLAKGSQNGVFAEESLKPLLAHPADTAKLVRQNKTWTAIKKKQFTDD
ncbi:hypothetical protein CSA80_04750 [Candidatus Saccharibacteria bacterium]|nr:MAG: hypothetical protein CSA80_04750 [Candidatus Saccharibacteria bacterium]